MSHIVEVNQAGDIIYDGMLSSYEKAEIDEIIYVLQKEIPQIEIELAEKYGSSVLYKYYMGKVLENLLMRFDVSISERRLFWDEIKKLATQEERKRNEGKNSKTRSFYEQCFVLSQQNLDTVQKLSWRQWQDLLDRVANREDPRIFTWIKYYPQKIKENEWREFEKALYMYLKNKDTSVFEDDELFAIYDSIMLMCQQWFSSLKEFEIKHPKSAKLKSQLSWSKKYKESCFLVGRKEKRIIDEDLCKEVFTKLMDY